MKKNILFTLLILCFLHLNVFAQGKKKTKVSEPFVTDVYQNSKAFYTGKDVKGRQLDDEEVKKLQLGIDEAVALESYRACVQRFPIIGKLILHMRLAQPGTCLEACAALHEADSLLFTFKNRKLNTATDEEKKRQGYENAFGIEDLNTEVSRYYSSSFCTDYHIARKTPCKNSCIIEPVIPDSIDTDTVPPPLPKPKPQKPEPQKPEPPKVEPPKVERMLNGWTFIVWPNDSTVIRDENNRIIGIGRNRAAARLDAMDGNKYVRKDFESKPLNKVGFEGSVPDDGSGDFYKILFKSSEGGDTLNFSLGQFWLDACRNCGDSERLFGDYYQSVQELVAILKDLVKDYGPNVFEIVLIGSADADKPGAANWRSKMPDIYRADFSNIEYLKFSASENGFVYRTANLRIGEEYGNIPMPNMRAHYIRRELLRQPVLRGMGDRIRILDGKIEKNGDSADRNVSILLYVNKDIINGKMDQQTSHSPYSKRASP